MQTSAIISFVGAVLSMGSVVSAAFDGPCKDVFVVGGGNSEPFLVATCTERGTGAHKSKLNLNQCYTYTNGAIVYADTGSQTLQTSCTSCTNDGFTLICTCSGSIVTHDMNTGTEIQDSNGATKCFGYTAIAISKRAEVFIS